MTQPADAPLYITPAAQAARTSAIEVYTQYEAALYAAYLAMITDWLQAVQKAVFAGGVKALALIPDPYTVFSQTPLWSDLVDTYTQTVVSDVLAHAYHQVLPGVQEFASRPFVHNFIATSANKMKGTPNEVFAMVKQIVDSAVTNGASIPDIADQIEALLSATGTDTWKTRAQTVARTEVHAAYEGGMYDAFTMLVEADTETEYVARWLATEDERTRPTHRKADGETVPFGTPFSIGGYPMLYPGDPAGPASEVINCRCTLLLEEKDQPTDMSNRGFKMTGSLADYAAENRRHLTACLDPLHKGPCKGYKRALGKALAPKAPRAPRKAAAPKAPKAATKAKAAAPEAPTAKKAAAAPSAPAPAHDAIRVSGITEYLSANHHPGEAFRMIGNLTKADFDALSPTTKQRVAANLNVFSGGTDPKNRQKARDIKEKLHIGQLGSEFAANTLDAHAARPAKPRRPQVIPAGSPPMTLAQAAQFGFNPLEKRDSHGKWTLGGKIKEALKGGHKEPVGPGGDTIFGHGHGKNIKDKTVHQVAMEHLAGKHKAEDLPSEVSDYLKQRAGTSTPAPERPAAPTIPKAEQAGHQAARDASLLRQEARRLDDLEEHGASGPDAARILRQAERYRHETPQQRLNRLRRQANALEMD